MLSCRGCSFDYSECGLSAVPLFELDFSSIKNFDFSWPEIPGASFYYLSERILPSDPFVQIDSLTRAGITSFTMPLHLRFGSSYSLTACNQVSCAPPGLVNVIDSLAGAVGYVKAPSVDAGDEFGYVLALSGDGMTLAVGASLEDSNAVDVGGDTENNDVLNSGAVYVFAMGAKEEWHNQAYVKAPVAEEDYRFGSEVALSGDGDILAVSAIPNAESDNGVGAVYVFIRNDMGGWSLDPEFPTVALNSEAGDQFGVSVALDGDGDTLAVGASHEDGGIDGDDSDNSVSDSGAAYVFLRNGVGQWESQVYLKASVSPGVGDHFGSSVALSASGDTLAVSAIRESSNATGIDGDETDNSAPGSGATYVFVLNETDEWERQAYIKASNTEADDSFGQDIELSDAGYTLVVGASGEDGNGNGEADNSATNSGAAYVFVRLETDEWEQQRYLKAFNPSADDQFAWSLTLSGDGSAIAIGAPNEASSSVGIGGSEADNSVPGAGATYVFTRDGMSWLQRAYVKASNTESNDHFGRSVALSGDGVVLAVGAPDEAGLSSGIGGDQSNDDAANSGAVYLF